MKKWIILLAAALLLCGCRAADVPATSEPEPEPETEPEPAPALTAQEVVQWLADPDHFVFYVDHFPEEHIITAERKEDGLELTVWSSDEPIQTIRMADCEVYDLYTEYGAMLPNSEAFVTVQDFNFDGFEDFGCCYRVGNQPRFYHVWLWNDKTGQYAAEPAFDELSTPDADSIEEKIVCYMRGGMAGAVGDYSIYQWVDGELTEVRHIKKDYDGMPEFNVDGPILHNHYVSVTDLIDGEMKEVFRLWGDGWMEIEELWLNLWYTGE